MLAAWRWESPAFGEASEPRTEGEAGGDRVRTAKRFLRTHQMTFIEKIGIGR